MEGIDILTDWRTRTAVLATMHNKETVIAPLLADRLGLTVRVPEKFDTDQFGTFTRDITRTGNQLETAIRKAKAAMKITGDTIGIASEGSFGSHPSIPFLSSNLEIVVLIDSHHDLCIVGHHRTSNLSVRTHTARSADEVVEIATSWGFPSQGVILRRSATRHHPLYKELTTVEELHTMSSRLLASWFTPSVFIETDMRAHRCPPRMESIRLATIDLIENCKQQCPHCFTPGFVVTEVVPGLPCRVCGHPTSQTRQTIRTCQKCHFTETSSLQTTTLAEPGDCNYCNP